MWNVATIQVVIDDELLKRLDCELDGVQRARSAFVRRAIERELFAREEQRLEEAHRRAYLGAPQTDEERSELQVWARLSAAVLDGEPWDNPPA